MRLTTLEPVSPAQVSDLMRALRACDPAAGIRFDADGCAAHIDGTLTATQVAAAVRTAGIAGVLTTGEHVSGGSTCCGGCA